MRKAISKLVKWFISLFAYLKKKKTDPAKHEYNIQIAGEIGFIIVTKMATDRAFKRKFHRDYPNEAAYIDSLIMQIKE